MNLFGRKKAGPPQVTSSGGGGGGGGGNTTDAIGKLRDATETLEKREEHLQRKIDNEVKQARDFSKANKKQQALTCIKRKEMYDMISNVLKTMHDMSMTSIRNIK